MGNRYGTATGKTNNKRGVCMNTINAQQPIIKRTMRFIDRYGVKGIWLGERVNVPPKTLSAFLHGKVALSAAQLEQLIDFMDEYDRRMVGFMALEK